MELKDHFYATATPQDYSLFEKPFLKGNIAGASLLVALVVFCLCVTLYRKWILLAEHNQFIIFVLAATILGLVLYWVRSYRDYSRIHSMMERNTEASPDDVLKITALNTLASNQTASLRYLALLVFLMNAALYKVL